MANDWSEVKGARAVALMERLGEPLSELHERYVSTCEIVVLEEGTEEYEEALERHRSSDIAGVIEASGAVLLGFTRERNSMMDWLPNVVFSVCDGRAKLSLVPIDPMARELIVGSAGSYDQNYSFTSVYDDGSVDQTWGRATVMTPSSGRLGSWPGTGVFEEDLAAHVARVEARGSEAFRFETIEDGRAASLFYYEQLVPESILAQIYRNVEGGEPAGKVSWWPIVAGVLVALCLWWLWTGL